MLHSHDNKRMTVAVRKSSGSFYKYYISMRLCKKNVMLLR